MINDEIIPEADDEHKPPSQYDCNTEQTPDMFDSHFNMEVALPIGLYSELFHAKVKRLAVDHDGKPIGVENPNPVTDKRLYEVEYLDGTVETLDANVIAENILYQVD